MTTIETRSLTKRFGAVVAVDEVSFQVGPGEVVGLLGANGAGKTTTMKMLLGLLPPTSGSALIGGRPVAEVDRTTMGYVPQGLGLYRDLTVVENVEFASAAFGVPMPSLTDAGLDHVANRQIGHISLGLRRRVAFVVARCHNPSVLILDEPTSGVGPLGRARLWETIHQTADEGAAVLVSTHYMEEAEECDRVILMAGGREVMAGTVAEVVGRFTTVSVAGELDDSVMARLREAGGTVLLARDGWRVVGVDASIVSSLVGPSARVEESAATFEEAFVALSS
ncbi:MAG TPA: ABC transporter ATP-binding protein [Acidimicrobiia bacterium]|jgi:ABC-2 type transport system ATP-binding protein/ribosome-dependent ATPase|nr:ABC transporter ATP-binding protein [Acidimicrobiia bacterium]